MRLLRTLRLDPADTFIFAKAVGPGEWAVFGVFMFPDTDPASLAARERAAFRGGFLGIPSLGRSTLAQVVDVDPDSRAAAVELLAPCLHTHSGAPDLAAARAAAAEEIDFAASLYNHPPGTLIALQRTYENGAVRESFRTLRLPDGRRSSAVFSFAEAEDEDGRAETIDLAALARGGGA